MPYASRRAAATPITAAKIPSTTRMPLTRTSLSSEPNSLIAKFFSHGGVKSICSCPTATTGDPFAPVSPATSCPTPSAVAAASRPAIAPRPARRLAPGSLPPRRFPFMSMSSIRYGRPQGLPRSLIRPRARDPPMRFRRGPAAAAQAHGPRRQTIAGCCYEYEL